MTDSLVKRARELAEKASPAPWSASTQHYSAGVAAVGHMLLYSECKSVDDGDAQARVDAAFIAASRSLVPELCDALEAALKRIEELEAPVRTESCPVCSGTASPLNLCDYCGTKGYVPR